VPWDNTPAKRQRDSQVYGAEYRRNSAECKRQARGWCAGCNHRHHRLETDHIIPVSQGGTHALSNMQAMCKGPGTCDCHGHKTAREGNARQATRLPLDPAPRPVTRW
jgi:5-methylcytosine-specific restriction endonuclease McrA